MDTARNPRGPRTLTEEQRRIRDALRVVFRNRRTAEGLSQTELGRRIDPDHPNPKSLVSPFENGGGSWNIEDLVIRAHATHPTFTVAQALIDARVEQTSIGHGQSLLVAIENDTKLPPVVRRGMTAMARSVYIDYEIEQDSAQKRAERRDAARDAGIPDDMLAAWGRLSPEQQAAYVEAITTGARVHERSDAKKPAPRGRRKRTED